MNSFQKESKLYGSTSLLNMQGIIKNKSSNICVTLKIFIIVLIIASVNVFIKALRLATNSTINKSLVELEKTDFFFCLRNFTVNVLLVIILIALHSIFTEIQNNHSPFIENVSKRLRIIAVIVFLFGELPRQVIFVAKFVYVRNFYNFVIFDETAIIFLLFAFIVYLFSLIFEYGCMLQRENDQTL